MIVDALQSVPLNLIVTDTQGLIKSHQLKHLDYKFIEKYKDKPIEEAFDEWEIKDNKIVLASAKDKTYILFYTESEDKDGSHRKYIVIESEEFPKLIERVRELDKSNRELDAIIESSYDGIYITDILGNTLRTNSAIERITGIPKHYYIGKNTNDLIKRGILQESVTKKVMEKKKTVTIVQKNFNGKETLLTGSPVFNEKGEIEKIVTNIRDLSELNQLNEELKKVQQLNERYKEELQRLKANTAYDPDVILKSEKMIEIYDMVDRLADFDTTLLVLGETGVGKDVLVRHLYRRSSRSKHGQLVKVNCGAIPKDLLESELFGYEGGAFSGAIRNGKIGMFELAEKGMLFLDEVGELPIELQVKLLRAIQEKEIIRVGGTKVKKVDIQLVAATNKDLMEMVKRGEFREDLYYRLNVVPISVPPLRDRKDDILPLVHYFLDKYNQKYSVSKDLHRDLKNFFYYYKWPGNVRELSNLMERLILTVPNQLLTLSDLPDEYNELPEVGLTGEVEELSLKEVVAMAEKNTLKKALLECKTTYEIAKKLKTSQPTVVRKLQKYHLSIPSELMNKSLIHE